MMRHALPIVLALLAMAFLAGCEEKVTQANYDKISDGMSQRSVENILGEGTRQDVAGTGISASGLAGRTESEGTRATYLWDEGGKQIVVTFEDQKVASKRKIGF